MRLAYLAAHLRRLAADAALDRIKSGDALDGLAGDGGVVGDLDVVELAAHMRPAGRLADAAGVVKMMEAGVAIGLQGPGEAVQMPARMLAFAVRRVGEPHRRRGGIVR